MDSQFSMDGRKRVWMKTVLKTAERKKNLNFESDYFKGFYSRGGGLGENENRR